MKSTKQKKLQWKKQLRQFRRKKTEEVTETAASVEAGYSRRSFKADPELADGSGEGFKWYIAKTLNWARK